MSRVVVIGAGAGGLAAALTLAGAGCEVTVLERAGGPGGKMRTTDSPLGPVDAGPTVFTMRFVFEALFRDAGLRLEDFVRLSPLQTLARHAWSDGPALDLFADPQAAEAAIGAFAGGQNAAGFRRFLSDSEQIYQTLLTPFMTAHKPSPLALASRVGVGGLARLLNAKPFQTLWDALCGYFPDPRLRQLFARYATYTGASPFAAPATLMLIAHVEQSGVWSVDGGMRALAFAIAEAAASCGARFRFHTHAKEITARGGRVTGVTTDADEHFPADAVVANADIAAFLNGAFGASAQRAVGRTKPKQRSLSALTWTGAARVSGFGLLRHSVFFSDRYQDEFTRIFKARGLPKDPTIYICAQDRDDTANAPQAGERLLVLVNAPAAADETPLSQEDIERCQAATFARLIRCGLSIKPIAPLTCTRPQEFHRMFPHSGGAIYGPANHGPMAAFQRQSARTKMTGLYLAGGSVHPSAGVPMATISGRLAAQAVLADRPSIRPFFRAATSGGTLTPSPTTAATD